MKVKEIIKYLHNYRKRRKGAYPILLAGSSFGGYVAMHLPH